MSVRRLALLGLIIFATPAVAQRAVIVGQLRGYKCMGLNITVAQAMDPTFHVPFYAQPSSQAAVVGYAGLQVAVSDPERVENGFVEALFPTGASVWIARDELTAYHSLGDPMARCVPVRMSNGRIGFQHPH